MRNSAMTRSFFVMTVLLAAIGCWFCWHCPSRVYLPHELFWRQLAWNGVGIAVFLVVWLTGWERILKAAPWMMAAWLLAFAAAQFSPPVNGAHRWVTIGPVRINVMTCFIPVFALFAAWLHAKRWVRPWMERTAVAAAAIWAVWHVAGDCRRLERLMAFFGLGNCMQDMAYMSRQLLAAFDSAKWFGDAGKSLGFLPCPESDGMMSASALMFGKWFPSVLVGLFAVIGASLTLFLKCVADVPRRRFTLLFGLWLIVPAAYCLLHSLAFLPVAGMSPALVGYGGTAVVTAWFGMGTLAAMSRSPAAAGEVAANAIPARRVCVAWGVSAVLAIAAIAFAPGRECRMHGCDLKFAEPRPSDMEFGEFGLMAKRGRILAADDTPLAYSERAWRFHLDPKVVKYRSSQRSHCPFPCSEVAEALEIPEGDLFAACKRDDSRYVFLKDAEDGSPAAAYFDRNRHWLTGICGIIREPVQRRVYPLGADAAAVVGFMYGGSHTDNPKGAGGLESACDKSLAGVNGVYDKKLPLKERNEKATPKPGADIQTTLVPEIQKAVAEALSAACATNGAESAWGIVMKVPSGEIAAMASWPTFDPMKRRPNDGWTPSLAVNHAVQDCFEPGGLVKPFTYAIALDLGVLSEDAKIDQEDGAWEYNGATIRDDETNALSIAEAIACRANIAAGKTACLIGPEKLHAALLRFGFGSKTHVNGIPGESFGLVTSRPEYWKLDKITGMRVGMGYGFAATGIQIVQAYATLANHGRKVRPCLLTRGVTAHDEARGDGEQDGRQAQVVSSDAADAIVRMLKDGMPSVVQTVEGMSYSPTNHIASYVGFCPAARPQYVVAVAFDRPLPIRKEEDVARPAFDAIAGGLLFDIIRDTESPKGTRERVP